MLNVLLVGCTWKFHSRVRVQYLKETDQVPLDRRQERKSSFSVAIGKLSDRLGPTGVLRGKVTSGLLKGKVTSGVLTGKVTSSVLTDKVTLGVLTGFPSPHV